MTMNKKGRTKLTEECGELVTVLAKIDAFGSLGEHWDGKGLLSERLSDEIADVMAACLFVIEKECLPVGAINVRRDHKQLLFRFWDAGGKATKLPVLDSYEPGYPYCHAPSQKGKECDKFGDGGFMGHDCRPTGYYESDQVILRQLLGKQEPDEMVLMPLTEVSK